MVWGWRWISRRCGPCVIQANDMDPLQHVCYRVWKIWAVCANIVWHSVFIYDWSWLASFLLTVLLVPQGHHRQQYLLWKANVLALEGSTPIDDLCTCYGGVWSASHLLFPDRLLDCDVRQASPSRVMDPKPLVLLLVPRNGRRPQPLKSIVSDFASIAGWWYHHFSHQQLGHMAIIVISILQLLLALCLSLFFKTKVRDFYDFACINLIGLHARAV